MSLDSDLRTDECDPNCKRSSYMDWDEYFMALAFLVAKRSKDPVTQVGACIVDNENRIVSVGYNGMPRGCSDDAFPWQKKCANRLNEKKLYVCHAEVNAILSKNCSDVKDCRMYVGLFPCNECAKIIIQSGIKIIIYLSDKYHHKIKTIAAKRMFDSANVQYRQYTPKNQRIVIDFNSINFVYKNKERPFSDDEDNCKENDQVGETSLPHSVSLVSPKKLKSADDA